MLRRRYLILDVNSDAGGGGGGVAPAAGTQPPAATWRDSLPDDIKGEACLQPIADIGALAKGYVHAQKLVGSDKIFVPSQHATDQDWQQVFRKLGVPEKVEDYKIERPKDASFDDEFVGQFKSKAHAFGILPKQAQSLVNWFNEASKSKSQQLATQYQTELTTGLTALKQEWGQAYDAKLSRANQVAEASGGKELLTLLTETGLNNHPTVLKAFAKLGDMAKEDSMPSDAPGGSAITPAQADSRISEIYGNSDHPYHKQGHPGHKAAVDEMSQLFSAKFGNEPAGKGGKYPRTSA